MTKQSRNTYHLISLGCAKNLVDSESMAQLLNQQGLNAAAVPENAEYLIVNTCGFLKSARFDPLKILFADVDVIEYVVERKAEQLTAVAQGGADGFKHLR